MGAVLKKETNCSSYNKQDVKELRELLSYIYVNNDECFVRVLNKGLGITKTYPINAFKQGIKVNSIFNSICNSKQDIFMSLNPFRTMKSGARGNLFCINAIAVDVDYKSSKTFKNLEPKQVIKLLELDFFEQKIPTPNLIEYGNQIRLIYTIETCYIPKNRENVVTLARRVSEVFANELKDYGAEKQNIESYFRPPKSINSKNGSEIKFIAYDNSLRYTLRELQELWLDELPKWYKRRKGRVQAKKKVIKLHNVYILNSNRLRDLEKIQEYLNENNINDYRARLCFLYRNFYLIKQRYQNGELISDDFENAKNEMLEYNKKFNRPFREHIIEVNTRCVNNTQYLYKNETLLNFLDLTWEQCILLGLESIYKPKSKEQIDKDYYKRNSKQKITKAKEKYKNELKAKGKLSKKEELKILRQKIKALRDKGFKNKEISIDLNIPIKTLERHITYMRKNGLM